MFYLQEKKQSTLGSSKTKWHPLPKPIPPKQTATFALYQQVSGKLSVSGSAVTKVSWSCDWHRLLPSTLSLSHTFSPHPVLLWHCKELAQEIEMAEEKNNKQKTKRKSSNNYHTVEGLLFICMHTYEKLTLQIYLFLFILLAQFPKDRQRLLWHCILKQKLLHFHLNQF